VSYSANLSEEVINSQFLAVITPRSKVLHSSFSLYSGSVYRCSFSSGPVYGLSIDGVALTSGSSVALSAGQFYYISSDAYIYLRKGDSTAPNSGDFIVVEYEIYVGTFDIHWHRLPTDDSSDAVYFDPRIVKSPVIKQSSTDTLFGFFPTSSTSIELSNTDHYFESVISDSSFNKATIKVWHLLGATSEDNFRIVLTGSMSSVSYNQETISIQILDETNVFDQEYRHSVGSSFFSSSDFPNIDPAFIGRPIRQVFGVVNGVLPVNIDYNYSAPTTSNNRIFVVKNGQSNLGNTIGTVTSGSTTTVTNVVSADGFIVGDSIWLDRAVGTDQYVVVTAVNYGTNQITHAAIGGGAMTAGDLVKRSFVSNVFVVRDNVKYSLLYGRDYTESTALANSCSGFTLVNNFEAAVSLPSALNPGDKIFCSVRGDKSVDTIGGGAFGSNNQSLGCLSQAVVIIYRIMKTYLGLSESDIDTSAFTSLQSSNSVTVGFSVPDSSGEDFKTYKDIISEIMRTAMLRLGKNTSGKWSLMQIGPMGSPSKTIEDDEIQMGSVSYTFDYSDVVSDVVVEYAKQDLGEVVDGGVSTSSSSSETAKFLHSQRRQKTVPSLHYDATEAATLAQRYSFALAERRGILTIQTKNRFFDVLLGDVIRLSRQKIPGYSYAVGTTRTKDFVVIETLKSLNRVTLTLDDQKGIEDNSGSW